MRQIICRCNIKVELNNSICFGSYLSFEDGIFIISFLSSEGIFHHVFVGSCPWYMNQAYFYFFSLYWCSLAAWNIHNRRSEKKRVNTCFKFHI